MKQDDDDKHWIYKWGLNKNSTKDDVTRAWRRYAQALHPDKTNDKSSNDLFIKLKKEYEILKNDKKRTALFNEVFNKDTLKNQNDKSTNNTYTYTSENFNYYSPSSDIEKDVFVELIDVMDGKIFNILIKRAKPCVCERQYNCYQCKGVGQVFMQVETGIKIPFIVPNGGYLTIDGMGDIGSHENGDLILRVFYTNKYGWRYNGEEFYLHKKMSKFFLKKGIVYIKSPRGDVEKVKINKSEVLKNNFYWVGDIFIYEFDEKTIGKITIKPSWLLFIYNIFEQNIFKLIYAWNRKY